MSWEIPEWPDRFEIGRMEVTTNKSGRGKPFRVTMFGLWPDGHNESITIECETPREGIDHCKNMFKVKRMARGEMMYNAKPSPVSSPPPEDTLNTTDGDELLPF